MLAQIKIHNKLIAMAIALTPMVFLLVGCGGGSEQPVTAPATGTAAKTAAKAGATTVKAENSINQVFTPTDLTPGDFKRSLEDRRAIVVNFYITGPYDDTQVHQSVTSLETKFRGQVDFYNYLYTDGQRFGDLMDLLLVNSTPSVIIINRQAKVQRAWTGYVDSKSIEQGITEAMK